MTRVLYIFQSFFCKAALHEALNMVNVCINNGLVYLLYIRTTCRGYLDTTPQEYLVLKLKQLIRGQDGNIDSKIYLTDSKKVVGKDFPNKALMDRCVGEQSKC